MLTITVPMSTVSTKRSKREWIIFKHGSTVHYGHITGKSSNSKLLTVQHWTMNIPSNTNGPLTISLCTNCLLSGSSNCYIQIRLSFVITVIPTPKSTDHSTTKVIMHNIDDYAAQAYPYTIGHLL